MEKNAQKWQNASKTPSIIVDVLVKTKLMLTATHPVDV